MHIFFYILKVASTTVTFDRPIDPIGDGCQNKVFVQSKVIHPL